MPMPTNYIRRKKVAEILGIHPNQLYAWVRLGIFPPPVWLNGRPYGPKAWPQSEVEAYLASRPRGVVQTPGLARHQAQQREAKRAAQAVNGHAAAALPPPPRAWGFKRGDGR
jgi:predicted DNA-binding transcriptional regulator AlpA